MLSFTDLTKATPASSADSGSTSGRRSTRTVSSSNRPGRVSTHEVMIHVRQATLRRSPTNAHPSGLNHGLSFTSPKVMDYGGAQLASCGVEQIADEEADPGCAQSDSHHLWSAPPPVSNERHRRIGSHAEENDRAQHERDDERRRSRQPEERKQRDQVADESRDRDDDGAAEDVGVLDGLQMQFLIHHRPQPGVAVGRDGVDDLLEQLSAEALRRVDVADLLSLRSR